MPWQNNGVKVTEPNLLKNAVQYIAELEKQVTYVEQIAKELVLAREILEKYQQAVKK